VLAIVALMMALVVPAFNGLKSAGDVTKSAYDINGILEQSRAYAMANNTYVYVGIAEVDASVSSSAKPQSTTGASPYGRVAIAVVASRDGTRGYDVSNSNLPNPAWNNYNNGAGLMTINKLEHFENVHLAASLASTGGMTRQAADPAYTLGNATCVSVTPFSWPLGASLSSGYQYLFNTVINFDPQGVARIQFTGNTDTITTRMEIGLQQTHGNVVSSSANVAAIQIDAMTGSTRIYRP
jgi:Tfp pilus assembly protein FimT